MALVEDIKTLFPDVKVQDGYCRVRCPYHKGGAERKPSMSILLENKGSLRAGYCRCFSCGWVGTFEELAKDFGLQYVPDNYVIDEPTTKPSLSLQLQRGVYKKDCPFRFSPYLESRGIDELTQRTFRVYESEVENKVYLPVFDSKCNYIFSVARSTVARKGEDRFFIDAGAKLGVAYIEEVDPFKPLLIVEGQINALTAYTAGFMRAVATLGAANTACLKVLKKFSGPFFLAFDADEAGKKATLRALDELGDYKCKVIAVTPEEDVNDIWKKCGFNKERFLQEMEARMISAREAREKYKSC